MNFLFISPNFPEIYSHFIKSLKDRGANVLGISDCSYNQLNDENKQCLTEYVQVIDMHNIEWMKSAIDYLQSKYGHIDFLESNNEYWLYNDSILREYAHIDTGFYPKDMDKIKYKSEMKKYFNQAGVKTARYTIVSDLDNSLRFINEVGYPVFCKPNNGVGACSTYKISNYDELVDFHNNHPLEEYIMEEFINGHITSFDGMCDIDGNVLFAVNENFSNPIDVVAKQQLDVYYYASLKMDDSFRKMGEKVVKAFGISKRCFHIEFFVLDEDKEGFASKGEIVALEVNMRPPGGDTPILISYAIDHSFFDLYAEMITTNSISNIEKSSRYALSVCRRDFKEYKHTIDEVKEKYSSHIVRIGRNNKNIADDMGDEFMFGIFNNVSEMKEFQEYYNELK